MIDRPDAVTLLHAMATTLTEDVVPTTSGAAQHATRVVANLCRILEREWIAGDVGDGEIRERVAVLLGDGAFEGDGWAALLDERLRANDEVFDERARPVLLADVRRRLAINRPGYDT